MNMKRLFCVVCNIILTISPAVAEHDYFPGLRRTKPNQAGHSSWIPNDVREGPEFLKTINELIEEQARRRFLEHLHRFQLNRNILQRSELEDGTGPAFTYQLPLKNHADLDKPIQFAVDPSDPRFYDRTVSVDADDGSKQINEQESYYESDSNLPPSPPDVKPKLPINHSRQSLEHKLRNREQRVDDNLMPQRVNGVIQRPVEMDRTIAMYVVALIGGISAAVTVGIVAVGVGWYTLHKKAKAAADVDYPAYGVTGPNKDSSPLGDRRLAQSAQMYHYQHQKQQIIAMENHNNADKNGPHSDVESEDDNEEGDYTVYECPGLAPTGEMEVKNPLFLDDTSLTPATAQAATTVQEKQSTGRMTQALDSKDSNTNK